MKRKSIFSLCLALLIAIVAGCQTIGSVVDMQKVLYNPTIKSYEGKSSISIQLGIDSPKRLTKSQAEDLAVMNLFNNMKLVMQSIKVEDADTMSMTGQLELSKGQIPFAASMNGEQMVLQMEGADQPIVFESLGFNGAGDTVSGLSEEATQELIKSQAQIQDIVAQFIVKHLPNPKTIDVLNETVTIHEESMELKHIHAEMNGSELTGYILDFLGSVIADEVGLRNMMNQVYELMTPIIVAQAEQMGEDVEDIKQQMKSDQKQIVDDLVQSLKDLHVQLKEEVDMSPQYSSENFGLDEKSTLKVDLFVNDEMHTLKSKVDLFLQPTESLSGGAVSAKDASPELRSVRIIMEEEKWNLNGDVKADLIVPGKDAMVVNEDMSARKMVHSMDVESLAYQVMKHELHMARQTVEFDVDPRLQKPELSKLPYIDRGVAMVSVRSISDEFDSKIKFNKQTKEIVLLDEGKQIKLSPNSKVAFVDGKKKVLATKVVNRGGVTYIPAKSTLQFIDANVNFNKQEQVITIQRD